MHSWSIILLSVGLAAGSGRLTNSGNNNGSDSDSLEGPVRPSAFVDTHEELVVIEARDVGLNGTGMIDDGINYEDDVKFILFTAANPSTGQQLYLNNQTSIDQSNFDTTRLTKIIIDDGSVNNSNSPMPRVIAFLQNGDFNVIAVDWSSTADDSLNPAVESEVHAVGKYVGKFIEFLIANASANFSDVHLIGYRFGAHVSGFAGKEVQKAGYNVSRITGLDPVIQRFEGGSQRLNVTDADFVDVIHTDTTDITAIGLGNYYPNGGLAPQPGCPILDALTNFESCSSTRAYEYFAASINLTNAFFAAKCDYLLFGIPLGCSFDGARMGYPAEEKNRGLFYLKTNKDYPYAEST